MPTDALAVLLNEAGQPASLEEITVDAPGPGEVQVKLVASGVCHTDLHVKNMAGMGMAFPILLGHEGAGIIESVGEGVTHLAVGDPVAKVRELSDGEGVDFAFEAVGIPQTIDQAIRMLAYAGTATHIGLPEERAHLNLNLGDMDTGVYWNKAALHVCHCGDALPSHDFPLLAQLYLQGKLDLDRMVTREIGLGDVEAAFHEMESGDVIRSVIRF